MNGRNNSELNVADIPFADDALKLLAEARSESDRLRHQYVGTEHLVFAVTSQTTGVVAEILARLGVDRHLVRLSLASIVKLGSSQLAPGAVRPYTSRTKRAFSLASESMRELGEDRVGGAHLLVGVMREGLGPGAQVLRHSGLTAESAFQEIHRLRAGGDAL